jgi:predicted ATP-binding protein involved in virulence
MDDGLGRSTGDAKTGVQAQMRQAVVRIEEYGQAVNSAENAIDTAREMPASVGDTIRRCVKSNPYTTAAMALSLGWLIGRSRRPF